MGAKPAGFRQDVKALTAEEAETLTAEITGILTDGYERAIPLVIKAFRGRAWVGCGFTSWDAYCKARFVGARMLRIPPAAFAEIALTYADAGMSVRAIGSATGHSKDTAARALNKSGEKLADVHGLDDRRQKRSRERAESIAAHPAGKAKAGSCRHGKSSWPLSRTSEPPPISSWPMGWGGGRPGDRGSVGGVPAGSDHADWQARGPHGMAGDGVSRHSYAPDRRRPADPMPLCRDCGSAYGAKVHRT
jgi:hypothetical protein